MTNQEFSNEFDVLYNNITSNQAPGLDEYEKSVFLTKAQDEIVKAYFNPRTNKTQEGFDGNEKRQIDFSMLIKSAVFDDTNCTFSGGSNPRPEGKTLIKSLPELKRVGTYSDSTDSYNLSGDYSVDTTKLPLTVHPNGADLGLYIVHPFLDGVFDMRKNTKSVALNNDILMFINEYVEVDRNGNTSRLTVIPINYTEYSRLMSKPFKHPIKNQAWRLLDNSDGTRAEIIVGPKDEITKYVSRYVKRPRAIILSVLSEDTSLDGYVGADANGKPVTKVSEATQGISCELDPILHPEILQRAVELAKAAYIGDLNSQVALGQTSQTNMGIVTQSR